MVLTLSKPLGSPAWLSIGSEDPEVSAEFYSAVFGWNVKRSERHGQWGVFGRGGRSVAGIHYRNRRSGHLSWTVYFHASEEVLERARPHLTSAGNSEGVDAASWVDTLGARFALAAPNEGLTLGLVNESFSLYWVELFSSAPDESVRFYSSLLQWRMVETLIPGSSEKYFIISPLSASPDAAHGGILHLDFLREAAESTSHWLPYFAVPDCEETLKKAKDSGAAVRVDVTDVEGIGREAQLIDPLGIPFGIIQPIPSRS
ncbi:hypothetical protein ABZV60_31490 [Streptomyces sp. NPDC004787]|uniref:hypothetical protein n=1 Tax=Streptomyces sp. NPDC004787 TaxID=3154291 RepID=UPI0033A03EFF